MITRTLHNARKNALSRGLRLYSSRGSLNWPLSQEALHGDSKEKFSERLLQVEKHWKPILETEFLSHKTLTTNGKSKQYVLSMFPYPSGNLHMGHMRVYTISDVSARYYRLNGYNVIHPIGWDAFGLPAENAARDRGVDPREWTKSNISVMKQQLQRTGVQFDWEREIFTCEPDFYRWTQWIFCRLHERGLVKRCLAEVNWDPVDGTVLAAEQIDSEGKSWRSGAKAEKKKLRQWMVETPRYAKRLSEGLKLVENWHDVADIQSNWIGACDVTRFMFPLRDGAQQPMEEFLDLRLQNPLSIANGWFVVVKQGHALSDPSKAETSEPYKLSISVLNGVTGAWMPVVVVPKAYDGPEMILDCRLGDKIADSQLISKFDLGSCKRVMPMNMNDIMEIASFGGYGGYETSRSLQDWVVSRQREWGTPIPMIISEDGKKSARLQDNQLPLLQGTTKKGSKISSDSFPEGYGYLETDTLDTFFDSSWYYLRYLDPHNSEKLISKELAQNMPIDVYVGGVEHAAVHMFFARFISYFLTDIGVTSIREPFKHLIPQGIVRGQTFIAPDNGQYVKREDVVWKEKKPYSQDGKELTVEFEKMSKSKHNGVDPLTVLSKDGIDMTRLQLLEAAAPRQTINWGESDLRGLKKWLDRVAWVVSTYVEQRSSATSFAPASKESEETLKESYNYFVRNVSMCLEVLHLHNTALARLQGMTNALRKTDPSLFANSLQAERAVHALIIMLQIYSPHAAAELWSALLKVSPISCLERNESLALQKWPQVDDDCLIDFTLIVNGISCGRIPTPRKEIEGLRLEDLLQRSRSVEHKEFLDKLAKKNILIKNESVTSRDGFHLTINANIDDDIDIKHIQKTLDELQFEKRKSAKNSKKPKKDKKDKKKNTGS